jgi:arylformamidase
MTPLAAEAGWDRDRLDGDYTARACCSAAEFDRIIGDYARLSQAAQALPGARRDLVFEPETGLKLDLYGAVPGQVRPVVVFLHGGYWRALGKDQSAFMAPMLAARGIACAVPDYRLAPSVDLSAIVADTRRALAFLWHQAADLGLDRRRMVVTGSSAGGHLAAMLVARGWQAGHGLPPCPVAGVMPVSGLFELAPLAACHVQDWMRFDAASLAANSPLRHLPPTGLPMTVALAETETPGFVRQSAAYAEATGAPLLTVPGRNHFDVILDLTRPDSALSQALLRLIP